MQKQRKKTPNRDSFLFYCATVVPFVFLTNILWGDTTFFEAIGASVLQLFMPTFIMIILCAFSKGD